MGLNLNDVKKCLLIWQSLITLFLSRKRADLLINFDPRHLEDMLPALVQLHCILSFSFNKTAPMILLQANKEKISFGRLEVHEIAAFVLNSAGHYEAINRSCLNYYLSAESVALFTDHLPSQPAYIVGQIVHIERQTVRPLAPSARPERGRGNQMDNLTSDLGNDGSTSNVGATSTPYGLPVGCEYFIVTVAMLPDTAIHSPSPS